MARPIPDFDFNKYNPADPWNFPPQRLEHFAASAMEIFEYSQSKWAVLRRYPDLRFVIFHEMQRQAHGLSVFARLMSGQGSDLDWWEVNGTLSPSAAKRAIQANHSTMRGILQFGYFQGVMKGLEQCIRQVLRSLLTDDHQRKEWEHAGLQKSWRYLLNELGLARYRHLLPLMQAIRDSLSHGGKFCPHNRKDFALEYEGKRFEFQNGEDVDAGGMGFIDSWDLILYLLQETDSALNAIFQSNKVDEIRLIYYRSLEA